ncbi:MAG: Uncharacterized protein G01um10147_204 [Microgenomates group bacterium Gr01-1014_7]|nr:MAG: Uncharacterized protein G01um10147_204 [Microgenomates group bacterium Gr01-1014_7]
MADGGSGIKQFSEETESAVVEVAKEVKDTVGEMIEQGVQSVAGPQLTAQSFDSAQDKQKKQQEDQKKIAEARRVINFYKKTEEDLRKVREQKKQEETQIQQAGKQEEQTKKEEKFQQKTVSKQRLSEDIARSRAEIGKGHGIGG